MRKILVAGLVLGIFVLAKHPDNFQKKEKLSEYGFFQGKLSELKPIEGVVEYQLNTPLFSNYAEKLRFVKIPDGTSATFNDSVAFNFPLGTILIKNFYFHNDFRKPEKGRRIIETRLLVNEPQGWQAYPYIWNDEQTEAFYDAAGETKTISYINESGKKITTPYVVPNKNQCKGCHIRNNKLEPIGPSARQLNLNKTVDGKTVNQLELWQSKRFLVSLPSENIPKLAVFDDPKSGDLNSRARAYLDANCGHCHSRSGPASTSGLFLDIHETASARLGVNKSPVAAGRSLDHDFPNENNRSGHRNA
jgi:uncharacterized repeat protein (TIGR03806 family)